MQSRSINIALLVGVLVLCVLAVLVAMVFDSPTSVFILVGIAVVGTLVSFAYGLRAEKR